MEGLGFASKTGAAANVASASARPGPDHVGAAEETGERKQVFGNVKDLLQDGGAASKAAGMAAVRFVNTAAMKTVNKVGDGLSKEGIKSGLSRMGDATVYASAAAKPGLTEAGDATEAPGDRRRKRDIAKDLLQDGGAASKAAGMAAVRFVNTAAMKTVNKVGDGLSKEGIKSGLSRMGDATVYASTATKSGLTKVGDVTVGVVGATVSGTRTGLTSTVNATLQGAGMVVEGVDKLLGREKIDTSMLELDESVWNSWSRAARARAKDGSEDAVEDGLDFQDMARLEKLKARAIEWEQHGDAEQAAKREALAWLDDLAHDPLECEESDFDELLAMLGRLQLRLQHDTVDMCKANWVDFKSGLEDVKALEEQLIAARFVCLKGRDALLRARLQLKETNVAVVFRKKQVLQEVCVVTRHLSAAIDSEQRAREALAQRHPDYALARALCHECRVNMLPLVQGEGGGKDGGDIDHGWMLMKMPLDVGRDLLDRLAVLEDRIDAGVSSGLKEVCKDLDPSSFNTIFEAYLRARQLPALGEQVGRNMLQALDDSVHTLLFSSLAAHADSSGLNVEALQGLGVHELAPKLRPDRILAALVSCLQVICHQMLSLHGVLQATRQHRSKVVRRHVCALVAQGAAASEEEAAELLAHRRALLLVPLKHVGQAGQHATNGEAGTGAGERAQGMDKGEGSAAEGVEDGRGGYGEDGHGQGSRVPCSSEDLLDRQRVTQGHGVVDASVRDVDGDMERAGSGPGPSSSVVPEGYVRLPSSGSCNKATATPPTDAEGGGSDAGASTQREAVSKNGHESAGVPEGVAAMGRGSRKDGGSKWSQRGSSMWGQMKKAAATTASGTKGLFSSVAGEDAKAALAILAGEDPHMHTAPGQPHPHPNPALHAHTRIGSAECSAGGREEAEGASKEGSDMRAFMSAAAHATVSSMSYAATVTAAAASSAAGATLEAMAFESRAHDAAVAVLEQAALPEAAAAVARVLLLMNGWSEAKAPDVEQAWVLEAQVELMRAQMWDHAQTRVHELLALSPLSRARLDEFARVCAATHTFMRFGEALTRRPPTLLREALARTLCPAFGTAYHRSNLATLATALESDFWKPYPCDADFDLASLHEIQPFLVETLPQSLALVKSVLPHPPYTPGGFGDGETTSALEHPPACLLDGSLPSHQDPAAEAEEQTGAGTETDIGTGAGTHTNPFTHYEPPAMQLPSRPPAAAAAAATTTTTTGAGTGAQVMTAGTIKAVRLVGDYLLLMALVPQAAQQALEGLAELVRYYIFTVVDLFSAPDSPASRAGGSLAGLRRHVPAQGRLGRLLEELEQAFARAPSHGGSSSVRTISLEECHAPLTDGGALYGIGERCAAIESLRFLATALQQLRAALDALAPRSALVSVRRLYEDVVAAVPEVREAMYRRLPKVSLPMHDVVESMVRVKWDSKEMPERHSEYVDVIHRRFLELLDGLEQMRMLAIVSDDSLRAIILRGAVLHVMEELVDGYSRIKSLGQNAPLIMSSDINVLKDALEMLPPLRPLPFFSHVETFTKHPCYAPHQVIGLVKALLSQGGGGGGALKMNNIFSNSNKNELKLLLAQVTEATRTHSLPSATITLEKLVSEELRV